MVNPAGQARTPVESDLPRLLAYVADLELEVDRLRRHQHLLLQEVRAAVGILGQDADQKPKEDSDLARRLAGVLEDLHEIPGYHPAHDQVAPIAVRPLAEHIFRWQQRLQGAGSATLELALEEEIVEWFPARLRHILDNLISNALKYRDPDRETAWVRLGLRTSPEGYEFRVTDNGVGLRAADREQAFDLFYRATPAQASGMGVGLAVVKLLVEQSGGSVTVDENTGEGSSFVVTLPRYPLNDFLI